MIRDVRFRVVNVRLVSSLAHRSIDVGVDRDRQDGSAVGRHAHDLAFGQCSRDLRGA